MSLDIIDEAVGILADSPRLIARYRYRPDQIEQFRLDLTALATIVDNPAPVPGAVPRDPDDDKIIACAVAAGVQYIVSRDQDLLSLGAYSGIAVLAPEDFLPLVRTEYGRLPD